MNRPIDAASIILYKTIKNKKYLLMGRRPPKQKFMPDIYVFPGGAVEKEDKNVEYYKDYNSFELRALSHNCSKIKARAIGLAAIRETFEETGILIGKKNKKFSKAQPKDWSAFYEKNIQPRLDVLHYIARAVTPKGQIKRFNARFFICDAKHSFGSIIQNDELLEVDWYPIDNIIEKLNLAQVTQLVVKQAKDHFNRNRKKRANIAVPTYSRRKGNRVIRYKVY